MAVPWVLIREPLLELGQATTQGKKNMAVTCRWDGDVKGQYCR